MSTPGNGSREPGGWELLRAVQDLGKRLDEITKGFVPYALYQTVVDDVKDLKAEVAAKHAEHVAAVEKARGDAAQQIATLRKEADDAKKSRAQTWTAIGLLFVGGAVTLIFSFVRSQAGLP